MTIEMIFADLKQRNEHSIHFYSNGIIYSKNGKHTNNYWRVVNDSLVCIDCKTVY